MKIIIRIVMTIALAMGGWETAAGEPEAPLPVSRAGQRLIVIFMKGFDAATVLDNPTDHIQDEIRATFAGHNVEFKITNTASRTDLATALFRADIFYLNAHAVTPYQVDILSGTGLEARKELMQGILVAPSDDNKDKSPGGNSIATALYIRQQRMAQGPGKGPRLVIVNGCSLTDRKDGVIMVNRISHAVGVPDSSTDRTFVGWDYRVLGGSQDGNFAAMLRKWTTAGPDGTCPTIEEAINATNWGAVKQPVIVGARSLRYK
ncbi:MAG: hypothetical protein AB1714_26365 [Acidobacteriota bacterium]